MWNVGGWSPERLNSSHLALSTPNLILFSMPHAKASLTRMSNSPETCFCLGDHPRLILSLGNSLGASVFFSISFSLSRVQLFAVPWTVACQTPLPMGILQLRLLAWVAMPSSRGSSQSRDQTQVSLIVGGFFTIWALRGFLGYLDSVSFSTTPWFIILFYLTSWKGVNGKIIWF